MTSSSFFISVVHGAKNVKQVDFCLSSLNKCDAFILDGGKEQTIFVYMPSGASNLEKFKATQVANEIRDEDHAVSTSLKVVNTYFTYHENIFYNFRGTQKLKS